MKFNIRHIDTFRAIMISGSITEAAKLMNTSQPTLSRDLKRFEDITGISFFLRQKSRLVPTPDAYVLMEEINRAYRGMDSIARTIDGLKQQEEGRIYIASLPALTLSVLPAVVRKFRAIYPRTTVIIETTDLTVGTRTGPIYDLGLVEVDRPFLGVNSEILVETEQVCILPCAHPLASKDEISPQDLKGQPFIFLSHTDPYRVQLDALFAKAGVVRHIAVEVTSAAAVCALVREGVGVAIINPFSALDQGADQIVVKRLSVTPPYGVVLLRPQEQPLSKPIKCFAQLLRDHCAEKRAAVLRL